MSVVARFLEYLVTGSLSLIWLVTLGQAAGAQPPVIPGSLAVVAVAIVYVAGMLIDFISRVLVWLFGSAVDREAEQKILSEGATQADLDRLATWPSKLALVTAQSETLAREIEARSTRDRIARGTTINLFLAWISTAVSGTTPLLPSVELAGGGFYVVLGVMGLLVLLSFFAWWRFERLTRQFTTMAALTLLRIAGK